MSSLLGASESRIVAAGVVFLLTLISGVWLSSGDRPLNVPIFTAHKLIALVATVLIGLMIYNLRGSPTSTSAARRREGQRPTSRSCSEARSTRRTSMDRMSRIRT